MGQMNNQNWEVMSNRLKAGILCRNENTVNCGWPYKFIALAAEPQARAAVRLTPARPPAAAPTKRVVVMSVGLKFLSRWFTHGCRTRGPDSASAVVAQEAAGPSRGRGKGAAVDEALLVDTVHHMLHAGRRPTGGRILLYDARGFHGQHPSTFHLGTFPPNMEAIVHHGDFSPLWIRIMLQVRAAVIEEDPAQPLTIVLYCKSGKHRSVALAWLTYCALLQLNYKAELWHAMRGYWELGSCNECQHCRQNDDQKKYDVDLLLGNTAVEMLPPTQAASG